MTAFFSRLACLVALVSAASACRQATSKETQPPPAALTQDARSHFDRGLEHMAAGAQAYPQATTAFQAALASSPDLWEAHLNIGVIALRQARLSEAAGALERSIEIHSSLQALEALGEVYFRQGHPKKAVELFERALSKAPNDLDLRNQLAVALRHAGRLDEAEAELRAILGRDAGNVDAYSTLAAIEMERENVDLAELILNKGLERHPDHPGLLTNMGLIKLARGDDQAAFNLFERASKADPTFLTGRLNKAAVYLGVGDHQNARVELEYVLRVEPAHTEALLGLGVAERIAGDYAGARAKWEQLLRIDPKDAAAHYNLAILELEFQDRPTAAREHLEQYLQVAAEDDPHVAAARERLELAKALEKEK